MYMAESNEFLGGINQNCSCDAPLFTIIDPSGQSIMRIEGPSCGACCPCPLFGDIAFHIFDMNRNPAGTILKRFTVKEVVSDANDFGLLIPPEMDPRLKAVLLGAVFSIVRDQVLNLFPSKMLYTAFLMIQDYSFFEAEAGAGRGKYANKDLDYCPCCRGVALMIWAFCLGFVLPLGITFLILYERDGLKALRH